MSLTVKAGDFPITIKHLKRQDPAVRHIYSRKQSMNELWGKAAIMTVFHSLSPCWVGTGDKVWASAKAPAWVTDHGRPVDQTIESESEGAGVRSLWKTLRFAPPTLMWTLEPGRTAVADTSWARQGPCQRGLALLGRRMRTGREGRQSRGTQGRRICCGPGALGAVAVQGLLHWSKNVGRNVGGWLMPPLGFWLVCMCLSAPLHDALCWGGGKNDTV